MSYSRQAIEKANEIMRQRRENAELQLKERKAAIYRQIPRIREIDEEKKQRYREIVSDAFSGVVRKKGEIKNATVELRAERAELLVSNGYPIDYLDLKFECRKCSDTGFVKGRMCQCYLKELNALNVEESNLGGLVKSQSFKNFKLDYYPDDGTDKSPRARMKEVLEMCKDYAEGFSPSSSPNLFFHGPTGLGKTFLSSCIASELVKKGFRVEYDSAQNIVNAFNDYTFDRKNTGKDPDAYMTCDLLIIDDLATEFTTSFSNSVIYNVLNGRIVAGKPMIISTNVDGQNLKEIYPNSVISRLAGEFRSVPFSGKDIRVRKNSRRKSEI